MEKSGAMLGRVSSVFFNLTASNTNDTLDKLEADLAPTLAAHSDSIYLNPRLYARVQALYNTRRLLGRDAQAGRQLERYNTHRTEERREGNGCGRPCRVRRGR